MEIPEKEIPGGIVPHLTSPYVYLLAEFASTLSGLEVLIIHDSLYAVAAYRPTHLFRYDSCHRTVSHGVVSAFLDLPYAGRYLPVADDSAGISLLMRMATLGRYSCYGAETPYVLPSLIIDRCENCADSLLC